MYLSADCGSCGSSINIDCEWEETAILLFTRFANAHGACGCFTSETDLPQRPDYLDGEGSAAESVESEE